MSKAALIKKIRSNQLTSLAAICISLTLAGCSAKKTSIFFLSDLGSDKGGGGAVLAPPPTLNSNTLAVGESKTLAITQLNISQVWGNNYESSNGSFGQLGLGIIGWGTRTTPQVLDAGTTYISVTSGETGSCALTSAKRIKCWGTFAGDGSGAEAASPVYLNDGGSASYIDVDFGAYHGCAVQSSGVATCWGDGWEGKLGNGDLSGGWQDSPIVADAGTSYARIATGRNHTCGITTAGLIRCWGTNSSAQLGDGTVVSPRLAPVNVDETEKYDSIAVGDDSSCAITASGVLKCWGDNGSGQLGDNSTARKMSPTIIDPGIAYAKVAMSDVYFFHTCGITTAGVLKCWGDNSTGQLGNGTTTRSLIPIVVDSGVSYKNVSVYYGQTCAVTTAGILKCWGNNGSGQLGLGNTTQQNLPAVVGSGY